MALLEHPTCSRRATSVFEFEYFPGDFMNAVTVVPKDYLTTPARGPAEEETLALLE